MKQEIANIEVGFDNIRHPEVFTQIAASIQEHVKKNKLVTYFKGKNGEMNAYPQVEAWQFCGALLGLFPKLVDTEDLSDDRQIKFRATVEIVEQNTGKVVGKGVAICSNLEKGKEYFQEYAVLSMAQTRSTGKAFRLCLGWIMKSAGFEPTMAEEMQDFKEDGDGGGVTDQMLLAEYRRFAFDAIKFCTQAKDVEKLVKGATYLKTDAAFLDTARQKYTELINEINNGNTV